MEYEEAHDVVDGAISDLIRALEAREELDGRILGLQHVIAGYAKIFPTLADEFDLPPLPATPPDSSPPRGAEAVRLVLQDAPGDWYRVSELVTELKQRSQLPDSDNPANAVRTALERLLKAEGSDVYKTTDADDRVVYCYDPDGAPKPPVRYGSGGYDPNEEPF